MQEVRLKKNRSNIRNRTQRRRERKKEKKKLFFFLLRIISLNFHSPEIRWHTYTRRFSARLYEKGS